MSNVTKSLPNLVCGGLFCGQKSKSRVYFAEANEHLCYCFPGNIVYNKFKVFGQHFCNGKLSGGFKTTAVLADTLENLHEYCSVTGNFLNICA